jgi:hypothetical protein
VGPRQTYVTAQFYFHNGDRKTKRLHLSKIKTLTIGEVAIEVGLPVSTQKTIAASCETAIAPSITDEQQIYNDNKLVPLIMNNPGEDENYVHDTVGTVPGVLEDANTTINPP